MRQPAVVWSFVADRLRAGRRAGLLIVGAASAGSPGRPGFALAVDADGRTAGTVGGGAMELRLVDEYASRLRAGETFCDLRRLAHVEDPQRGEASGLRCGGAQTVCAVSLDSTDLPVVEEMQRSLDGGATSGFTIGTRGLARSAGVPPGLAQDGPRWTYTDRLGADTTVLVVGAGHVGSALATVLRTLDLEVVLADARENLGAAHVVGFDRVAGLVERPEATFGVVMTSAVTGDIEALRSLLPLGLPYLGVMGTARKIRIIRAALTPAERAEMDRQHVRAPVGLDIGSHSPEEIAISVAAQIVGVRNGR